MHQQKHWILAYFKTTIWEWEIDRSYEGKRKQKLRLEYNSVVGSRELASHVREPGCVTTNASLCSWTPLTPRQQGRPNQLGQQKRREGCRCVLAVSSIFLALLPLSLLGPSPSTSLFLCPLRHTQQPRHHCLSTFWRFSQVPDFWNMLHKPKLEQGNGCTSERYFRGLCPHASGEIPPPTRVTMEHSAASVLELPHLRNKGKEPSGDRYF